MGRLILLGFIVFLLAMPARAQEKGINFFQGSWAEAMEEAKKSDKPIFVDAYAVWCGPCKWMDKNVFTSNEVADFYNKNFVNYKVDMEKGEGLVLAKKFEVRAYPSFLFFNTNGENVHRSIGGRESETFIQLGQEALNPETQYATLYKKYTAGERKPEFMARYISAINSAGLDVKEPLEQYYATQKPADLTSSANWKIIKKVSFEDQSSLIKHFEKNHAAYTQKYGADSVNLLLSDIYFRRMRNAEQQGNYPDFISAKKQFENIKVNRDEQMAKQYKITAEQMEISFLEKGKDMDAYAKAVIRLVENNLMESPGGLNNFAWEFYEKVEDKTYLTKAETWAKKAVELEPTYANLDTHAAVLYKLGKKNEAKTMAEKAIAQGKKENQNVADTETLLNKIKAMK